ncbi:MAG: phosphatidylserine decarboxylase family protein [Bacteroidota bacterium]
MIARDGYTTIALVLFFCTTAYTLTYFFVDHWVAYILYAVLVLLILQVLWFFRDPDRTPPAGPDLIIAPADGTVVLVKEVDEPVYIKGKAKQVSIFLSTLDVHVNRNPVSGVLEYVKYHPGKFLAAWDERASDLNERADFGVLHNSGTKVFYRQITGLLARRIVYRIQEGDQLTAGERFGMMKFGSRMDVLVPAHVQITVKKGDRTKAGESVLGSIESGS